MIETLTYEPSSSVQSLVLLLIPVVFMMNAKYCRVTGFYKSNLIGWPWTYP
jgi:hypothetical protein